MSVPRQLLAEIRELDQYELRRLLIVIRGLLLREDGDPDGPVDEIAGVVVSYRQEHVRCGKDACGTCPHGPYWYAYWKEGGRSRSQYVGRRLAGEPLEPVVPADE